MPLTVKGIASLRRKGWHFTGHKGLYVQVAAAGGRSWLFRYMKDGRARGMGLGPVDLVSYTEAQTKAFEARRQLLNGVDPLAARQSVRSAAKIAAQNRWTFSAAAESYIETKKAGWKGSGSETQWRASLKHCTLIAGADVATI